MTIIYTVYQLIIWLQNTTDTGQEFDTVYIN